MKKAILSFAGPLYSLVALILMGCSTSNAIRFDIVQGVILSDTP